MNLKKKIFLCVAQGDGGGPEQKKFGGGGNFFSTCEKINHFGNFVKIKVAKFKLNHLG